MGKPKRARSDVEIPDKQFFRIGEVAKITGLKPYVLRYWETEFPMIRPGKSKSKQRVYQRKDIEIILMIESLLYDEKFTIEGARKRIKEERAERREEKAEAKLKPPPLPEKKGYDDARLKAGLKSIRRKLVDMEALLKKKL